MKLKKRNRMSNGSASILLILFAALLIPLGTNTVQAKTSVPKAAVRQVKKGTSFKAGNLKYKVTFLSAKKKTVRVTGTAKKNLTKVVIPATVKITSRKGKYKGTSSFKVTEIGAKAFQKNKKIKTVKTGSNVTSIGSKAFYKCSKLQTVSLGKSVQKIGSYAFANCPKLTKVTVPKRSALKTIEKYAFYKCSKLKTMNLKNAPKLKTVVKTAFEGTKINYEDQKQSGPEETKTEEQPSAADYKYEIIPLLPPFNDYFYIKTDNPDPESFRFVDLSSKYQEKSGSLCTITPLREEFADVVYEDKKLFRVKGGYIAAGDCTDGGTLKLQTGKVTGSYQMYNLSTGTVTLEHSYKYTDTEVQIEIEALVDNVDYLIRTYAGSAGDFFGKMDAVQEGLDNICLYRGVWVKGTQKKGDSKWGLSTSPHADQNFYIQDPYYTEDDGMSMLISSVYPFRYDSIGFPSVMGQTAKRLDASSSYEWTDTHYLINVTYKGQTKPYGGAGSGGGQGIRRSDIRYYYRFDGSAGDAAKDKSPASVSKKICEYGAMEIPEEKKEGEITWDSVRQKVGDGSYVRLLLLTSIFGGSSIGYSYMYDQGYEMPGYISNAWYDGRYFNKWEYYYPGAKFSETVENEQASLVFKDFQAKLPEDGKKYLYWYEDIGTDRYDPATGIWKGYTTFNYDAGTKTWKSEFLENIQYRSEDGWDYFNIDDQSFIDACTITMEEALSMNLDRNTDTAPSSYYIYDMEGDPGTYHKG